MNPVIQSEYLFLLGAVLAAGAVWLGLRSSAKTSLKRRILISILRFSALACLVLILFNPGKWRREEAVSGEEWVLMLDRSSSMNVNDAGAASRWSRISSAAAKLAAAASKKGVPLRMMTFSSSLESEVNGAELLKNSVRPDGESTNLFLAGRELLDRRESAGKKTRGVVFLTDARQVKDEPDKSFPLRALASGIPAHVCAVGGEVTVKDVSISSDRGDYLSFSGQKLKISAKLRNDNAGDIIADVSLSPPEGGATTRKIALPSNSTAACDFEIDAAKPGCFEYELSVAGAAEDANPENNRASFAVTVAEQKLKILMVEGLPYWDSKFLAQLLRNDVNMELTALYRLSTDRFFRVEADAVRTSESTEPVFPDSIEEILPYNLLILGKGMEYFLNEERVRLLRKYVGDYGGAVLFARGKPYSGEFPELESLEPIVWGEPVGEEFHWRPTSAGEACGIFGGVLPGRNADDWKQLSPLSQAHRPRQMRAFTEVLCEAAPVSGDERTVFPILASLKFGRGIIAVNNCEGLWKWNFFPAESSKSDEIYAEFWIQTVQWLIRYSDFLPGKNFSMRAQKNTVLPGETIALKIGARIPSDKNPELKLSVHRGEKKIFEAVPQKNPTGGEWQSFFSPGEPGSYLAKLACRLDGKEETVTLPIFVKTPPDEKSNLSADSAFASSFASSAGGRCVKEEELEDVVLNDAGGKKRGAVEGEASWASAWGSWWFLCVLLFFFGAECFVRRRGGLL